MTIDANPIFNLVAQTRHGSMVYNLNDHYVGRSIAAYGEFSEGEMTIFRQIVSSGDVIIEAGANIGAHTVALSHLVGNAGGVIAFEPQRIVFQTLCANLALNQCINVIALQKGVSDQAAVMLAPSPDPCRENNFGGLALSESGKGEPVEVVAIDSLRLERCNLIKADVEGMEAHVIRGARETIRRFRPRLYLENDREEKSPQLIELLLSMNYRLWWHTPPLFNPENFARNPVNVFGGTVSINLLCQPKESALAVTGLIEVTSPHDTWRRQDAKEPYPV